MATWEFDITKGGSRRSDGLWFELRLRTPSDISDDVARDAAVVAHDAEGKVTLPSDYVWHVHFPGSSGPPVWVDPNKRDCHTPQAVEAYCDEHFPVSP